MTAGGAASAARHCADRWVGGCGVGGAGRARRASGRRREKLINAVRRCAGVHASAERGVRRENAAAPRGRSPARPAPSNPPRRRADAPFTSAAAASGGTGVEIPGHRRRPVRVRTTNADLRAGQH